MKSVLLSNPKLVDLARKIDEVKPKEKEAAIRGRSDIFEI